VRLEEDNVVTIGLTEEALTSRDEITKVRLPGEGDEYLKDETFGRLTTSRPAVFRLYAPVSGEVIEVNEDIIDAPDQIVDDAYEEGWLIRLELSNTAEYDDLMTRTEYEAYLEEDFAGDEEDLEDIEDEDEKEEADLEDDLEDDRLDEL
jgi:glycine cleavage system H protein